MYAVVADNDSNITNLLSWLKHENHDYPICRSNWTCPRVLGHNQQPHHKPGVFSHHWLVFGNLGDKMFISGKRCVLRLQCSQPWRIQGISESSLWETTLVPILVLHPFMSCDVKIWCYTALAVSAMIFNFTFFQRVFAQRTNILENGKM